MKTLITRIKRLALALCFVTPLVSWADAITAVNPVTGETETYTYKFIGTDTWNGTEYWQDSNGDNPSAVPAKSGDNTWDPILFDGNTININASMPVEGWNLRLGLYNGANVRLDNFVKWQGDTDMWVTVDGTSKFTVGAFGKGNIADGKVIKCSTTRANGIEWLVNLESTGNANNTFEYYLAGEGSVSYQDVTAANHKIKQADVALSGNEKSVQSKTLVTFGSGTTKTFTADAAIKVKNGDNVLKTVYLTSVTADATTLTTESDVGTCELVQTSTGIDLYWVDGDPAELPAAAVYKPSININFTDSGNGLTTGADVGLTDYEVPGTSWNNFAGSNGTYGEVKAVADSTGSASVMSGLSVTVSGTRGSWATSLPSLSNPLAGYIDENAGNSAPTVTVTGIPYYKYRVLVYHSTDTENVPFGYDTINGTNYTYVEDALSEGTTAWGNSGPDGSADAIAKGGNVLVTEAISGSTLTVVGHRAGGASNARGCIAAIQIIEVKADVGENDLEIPVSGDTPYTVEETKELSGTVYLTGSGTLTLAGENKISAATIDVGDLVTLVVNADRLDGTTFTGAGTVVYDGVVPPTGKGWTESAWTGTVWIKNKSGITGNNNASTGVQPNSLGNSLSKVKFSGVNGWIEAPVTYDPEIVLENAGYDYALQLTDGNSPNNSGYPNRTTNIKKLSGSGKLCRSNTKGAAPALKVYDASGFTGSIDTSSTSGGLIVIFCEESTEFPADIVAMFIDTNKNKSIYVASGKTVTLDSAATWTAVTGFGVEGTLVANGTLASSAAAAVTGSGMVTFGGVPSPVDGANETKWWKNAGWTGTVEIKGASIAGDTYAFNDYGNATSTVKLTNCSGWLTPNYTCVPALEIGGTFSWTDGYSGLNNTFKVATLKGSGTISIPNQGADTAVWQITDNWSGFTGAVVGNNNAGKRVLVFGSTLPASTVKGEIYVSEGATLNLDNASGAWWGVGMGFVVDGTVKASSRSKWGGGTYMKLGDTGVLELVSTSNTDDQNTGMGNITGTGTLKFSSTAGWRSFPKTDANMPATTLTIQTELDDSLILPTKNDGETVIGNLAGSKNIRSDWSDTGANGRILTVTQSKDTEWQGKFVSNRTTQFNVVAPAEGTPGTLTLSGTQSASVPMQIGGSVNLTGTWVGATTVAGTIGGTGTLTGDLTFSAGATLKAAATALAVSGTVAGPAEGTVTVDVTALGETPTVPATILTGTGLDVSKFALAEGSPEGYTLTVEEGALKLDAASVEITITPVSGATASVTVNGTGTEIVEGKITAKVGATVVVTYTAEDGYVVTGSPVQFTVEAGTTASPTTGVEVKAYVAWIYDENGYLIGIPYTDEMTAVGAFLQLSIGESIRFTQQSTFHDLLIAACDYDENTFTYTRKAAEPTVATITIGEHVYEYASLADAVAEGQNATIVLVDDIDLTDENENITIPATKNDAAFVTTIDLNGHSIAGDNDGDITVLGTLTLKDTAANSGGRIYSTTDYGTGHTTGLVLVQDSGVFNMESGAIYAVRETPVDNGQYAIITKGNARVNISGGTITAGWYVVGANNLDGVALTVNITGGTLVSTTDYALYVVGNMAVTISDDAAVSGAAGMASVRKGSLTISGGTFATSGDGDVGSWTDGTATLNPTKALINLAADYAVSSVAISGGSFTAGAQADCIVVGAKAKAGSTASVTGGSFSSDPSDFVAFGYKATETAGIWTVAKQPTTPPETPQVIDVDTTKAPEQQQADADAIAQDTVVTTPNADVAAAVSAETYDSYFTKTAVKVNEQWTVQTALNEEVVFPTSESDDLTADLADVLDVDAGAEVAITTAKPGLYYSIEAANSVDFATGKVEGERELATTTTVSPAKPAKTGNAVFYRVKASATPNTNN